MCLESDMWWEVVDYDEMKGGQVYIDVKESIGIIVERRSYRVNTIQYLICFRHNGLFITKDLKVWNVWCN